MAINIKFYNFQKKAKSTARPNGPAVALPCVLKEATSIIAPKIEVRSDSTPIIFNYAQIEDFNRWYKISNWTYDRGIWIAQLQIDLLATYKDTIGSSSLYIVRSSHAFDGRYRDNKYPMANGATMSSVPISPLWVQNPANGAYCVGITAKNGGFGSTGYYWLNNTQMNTLISQLLDDSLLSDSGYLTSDCSIPLQKSIADPLQYIKSCIYIPFNFTEYQPTQAVDIYVWEWKPGVTGIPVYREYAVIEKTRTITLPKHPQAAARGVYMNTPPYTSLALAVPPFGVIELDATALADVATLTINATVDITSGVGCLEIRGGGAILHRLEQQVGIPIQLSQITRDYMGAARTAVGGFFNSIGQALTGNIGGAIGTAANAAIDTQLALVPRENSTGQGGAFTYLYMTTALTATFYQAAADDNSNYGRPLMRKGMPSDYPGFLLIDNADVTINGTLDESEELKLLLESGFFYE